MRRTRFLDIIVGFAVIATVGAATAFASVTASSDTKYYWVGGSTVPAIRSALNERGPGGHDAQADGTIWWSWTYAPLAANGACRLATVSVTLRENYIFPAWTWPAAASQQVRAQWQRYVPRLWVHEQGHESISRQAADRIDARLQNFGSRGNCWALAVDANVAAQAIMTQSRQQQSDYDARTRHGATQGATFG